MLKGGKMRRKGLILIAVTVVSIFLIASTAQAVQNSAVVGIPDDIWGEEVCALVMRVQGSTASAQELIDHCKRHLARYKAPKKIKITDQLPLSPAGKVLRREVRRLLEGEGK
jgi:acyl-CoA synthetase (AMP-forming)/AMP-acid ligase II